MINLIGKTKIFKSQEFPVVDGHSIVAEGLSLIQVFEDDIEKVDLSAGGAAEVFMGVSYGEVFTPATKVACELLTLPAALTLTLLHAPISNTEIFAYDTVSPLALTIGNPINAGEYSVVGTLLTFNVARLAHAIYVCYRYVPTAEELVASDSVRITSFSASDYLGKTGVIQKGEVYTDKFDVTSDWIAATTVETGTGGYFDVGGGVGTLISNVVITHVASPDFPMLGLRLK